MTLSTPAAAKPALAALRTLRDLNGAPATTPEQRDALEAWAGWGSLASAFAAGVDEQWGQVRDDLDELVTDAALLDKAAEQLDTSFYTPRALVDLVFDLLRSVGFTGGRVLEPGCGTGRFLSWAPADLDIAWTGVEIDPLSASIAKALHPDADIRAAGLQDTHLPDEAFDAVIGNVPFARSAPFDPAYPSMPNLHSYAIMRGLAALKQGGYAIVVTSRHTLDSDTTREALTGTTDILWGTIQRANTTEFEGVRLTLASSRDGVGLLIDAKTPRRLGNPPVAELAGRDVIGFGTLKRSTKGPYLHAQDATVAFEPRIRKPRRTLGDL